MPRLLPILLAAVCAAAPLAAAAQSHAQSGTMNVEIDRYARVQLSAPAASVIVANPAIADVTMVDASTLFILGKGYGVTEVVAVDGLGRTLFQREVVVTGGNTGAVRVWRGAQATEMACGSTCAPSVRRAQGAGAATQ